MKIKRYLSCVLMTVVICASLGTSRCDGDKWERIKLIALDLPADVQEVRDVVKNYAASGAITEEAGKFIDDRLVNFKKLVETFNEKAAGIVEFNPANKQELAGVVHAIISGLEELNREGVLHIKNPKAWADFNLGLSLARTFIRHAKKYLPDK